jgi:hypothetical protein
VNINTGIEGKNVTVVGESVNGNGIFTGTNITVKATENVILDGTSTGNNNNSAGLSLWSKVEAGKDIQLTGENTSTANTQSAVFATNEIKSTGGTIEVNAIHKGTGAGFQLHTNGTAPNQLVGKLLTTDKDITIKTDSINLVNAGEINAGKGTVTIANQSAGTAVHLGGDDVTAGNKVLGISSAEMLKIKAEKLAIGSTSAGLLTVGVGPNLEYVGELAFYSGDGMTINSDLKANTLTLDAGSSAKTISLANTITAKNLELLGSNSRFELLKENKVDVVAAQVASLNFLNQNAMTIGQVNDTQGITATGDIRVATKNGDLTIAKNVSTSSESASAISLTAHAEQIAGVESGGNIVAAEGVQVTVGSGGIARLFTGATSGNNSVARLANAGNYRYNSDEQTTNFSRTLSAGVNVIYREKPTISVSIDDARKLFDGTPFNGGTAQLVDGDLRNSDTVTSAISLAGNAQGAVEPGSYSIEGGNDSPLGYAITYTQPGTLTIAADTTPIPPGPVVPPTPPSPNNNTVVVAGGSNSFQLAGAEGTCSADTLEQCECESASSATGEVMEGIQICYEPNKAR